MQGGVMSYDDMTIRLSCGECKDVSASSVSRL
jgi:hypothetical protein